MAPRGQPGIALLDVNVLIALVMPNHVGHQTARRWFKAHALEGWATTPVTESGFVRAASNRRAIATATSPGLALEMLDLLAARPAHVFWPDTVERVIHARLNRAAIAGYRQVSDAHLVSIALANAGRLVTFDGAITALVPDEPKVVEVLTMS